MRADPKATQELMDLVKGSSPAPQPSEPPAVASNLRPQPSTELELRQKVMELFVQLRYKDALITLRQSEFADKPWAGPVKVGILQTWLVHAQTALKEKLFRQAQQVATDILATEKDYPAAAKVRDQAASRITEITAEVAQLLKEHEFEGAYDEVAKHWPSDEARLKDAILKQWLAYAEQHRKGNRRDEADQVLAAMARRYDQAGPRMAINGLKRELERDRIRLPVRKALKATSWQPLRAAALALTGKNAGLLYPEEKKQLCLDLEQSWIALSRREKGVEARLARLRDFPVALQSKATQAAIADLTGTQSASAQITAALYLQEVTRDEFARSREKLLALQGKALGPKDRKRIERLLALLKQAEAGARQPLGEAVESFETSLGASGDLLPEDRAALEKIPGRLFALRIRQSIAKPANDVKGWEARRKDCQKVKQDPDTWVLACRVESLAELKRLKQEIDPEEWDRAWGDLREHLDSRQPASEAEPYAHYVRALALAASDRATDAATLLTQELRKKDLPAELQAGLRRQRAVALLLGATDQLRERAKGPLREPFGPAGGADRAFPWLELAYRLAGPAATDELRRNLVLAAWYKQQPDIRLAGQLVSELLRKESQDRLLAPEAFVFALIHARTRDGSAQGRQAALASYQTALERIRGLLRARMVPVARAFRENTVLPACEVYSIEVINPLCSKEGLAQFLPAEAGAELKAQLARLAAGSAELIKADLPTWLEMKSLGKNPLEKVVTLYDRAYQLASTPAEKADYLVHKAYAYHRLPHPTLKERQEAVQNMQEYAKTAITIAPQYAGGYALKGITLVYESRELFDIGKKLDLLRKADGELKTGLQLRAKLAKDKADELSVLLYQTLGAVCLELGSYEPRTADKAKYLHRGKDYLEQLLKRDDRNREAWDAYGLLLEDIGLYLGPAEEYYARACDALEKAMDPQSLWAGRTRPWLGRGRVQVRWATLGGKQANKLTAAAAADLQQVTQFGGDSLEAAEAWYWRGKLQVLQKKSLERVGQDFAQALKRFRRAQSQEWEEVTLNDWCTAALVEASALLARQHPDTAKYAEVVEDKARELEKFNKPAAAWFLLNAYRARCYATLQTTNANTLLDIFDRGLQGKRLQDRMMQFYLLSERARLYLEGVELKKDVTKAYADASAALKLAEQVPVSEDARALPLGIIGEACLNYQNAWKYYPEAVAKLRAAIKLSPTHSKAWWWKGLLAFTLSEDKFEAKGEAPANRWEEAARSIEETFQTGPRKTLDSLPFLQKLHKEIPEKALPVLQKAVKENGQAADAWKWHWRIAEILNTKGERLPALNHIRQAEQRIPANAPAAQRDRIVALRKQLEEAQ
jgi:hypothetical protein